MITNLSEVELVKLGAHHRASYLVQQAGYTLGVAAADGAPLAALQAANYLDEVSQVCSDVAKAAQDKTNVAVEAKHTTTGQNLPWRPPFSPSDKEAAMGDAHLDASIECPTLPGFACKP